MPEALEKWPVKVMGKLLPRHMEIIDKIDSIWKDSLKVRQTSDRHFDAAEVGRPWFCVCHVEAGSPLCSFCISESAVIRPVVLVTASRADCALSAC